MNGYMGKILIIDLTSRQITERVLSDVLLRKYIGGSGLGTELLFKYTTAKTNPLNPENPLIFGTGPLTGSGLFNTDRLSLVTKSPLTGIFAESSSGGYFAGRFKKCGFDTLVILGKAKHPVYISITDNIAEIKDASELWGKDTFETTNLLRSREGDSARAAVIGPAGEKLVSLACIVTDGRHGRTLGRCGAGAVMGSKNLKAIVANGTKKVSIANKSALIAINKSMAKAIKENMQGMKESGTGGGLVASEELGNLPIKNWGQGSWKAGAAKTTGMKMTEQYLSGTYSCGTCMISCGRVVKAEGGPYHGQEIGGPEYETLGLMGTNLMNDDLPTIIKANELCNRYGLDTISTAGVIGFGMEAWEKGLLTKKDTDDFPLTWGDSAGIIKLIRLIGDRNGVGAFLGQGVKKAAELLGSEAKKFAAEVKGLEPPAHDGRAKFTAALGLATSNRGACHLSGFSHDFEEGAVLEDLGSPALTNRFTAEGKAENVFRMQNVMGILDSAIVCKFALFGGLTVDPLIEAINTVTGWSMDRDEFFRTGERIFTLKRLYNNRLGLTRKDDTLPLRMLKQKRGGGTNSLPPLDEMLGEYYQYRGWNENGIPTDKKLKELGLENYKRR
jgi:aldehyde:ferredoxin oxidoreductase